MEGFEWVQSLLYVDEAVWKFIIFRFDPTVALRYLVTL